MRTLSTTGLRSATPSPRSVSVLKIPQQNALAAALIVLDAYLTLSDGDSARVDERLLAAGGVDVDGRDGAVSAEQLCVPRLPRGAQTAMAAAKADPTVSAAARLSQNGDAAVMLVGIAPHPIRARQIESVVRGRALNDRIIDLAAQTARSEAQPYGVGDPDRLFRCRPRGRRCPTPLPQAPRPFRRCLSPMIAAILLAAGESTRMGRPKQLLDWQDQPLVAAQTQTLLAAGCRPVVVVLGAHASRVRPALPARADVQVTTNRNWRSGRASSIPDRRSCRPARR